MSVASSYALLSIPNVNLMDFLVYLSSYLNGFAAGMIVGILSWFIYGTFNPLGFNMGILLACAFSEVVYAIAGCVNSKKKFESTLDIAVESGLSGALATILYDITTNVSYMFVFHIKPIPAIIAGLPFMAIHVVSNTVIFISAAPLIVRLERSFKAQR